MYKPFNTKNSIVHAALEAMAADAAAAGEGSELADGGIKPADTSGGTSPESTEQVQATDVENVDAVAALQERVAVLEDENGMMETDLIEAAGAKEQDDLDEAIDAAVALESLGELAMATYRNGTASLQSNAGIAIGLEHICSSLNFPSIVAAVEEDGVDGQGNAAKNLGERALAASKQIMKSVIEFFKTIKNKFMAYVKEQFDVIGRMFQTLKQLNKDFSELKPNLEITDEQFIKSIGFNSENPYNDFKAYIDFATGALKALGNDSLYRTISQLMRRDAADKTEQIFDDVMGVLGGVFPDKTDYDTFVQLDSGPVVFGAGSFAVTYGKLAGGGYTLKAKMYNASPRHIRKIVTIDPNRASNLLDAVGEWPMMQKNLGNLAAKIEASVNMNDLDTATPENVRSFMNVVSQITTVLIPMITRTNATTMRKLNAYLRKSLEVSRASAAA